MYWILSKGEDSMPKNEGYPTLGENAVLAVPGNYQPIYLEDTVGAIFMGILSVIFLIAWLRSEARYRKLIVQRELTDGNHSLNAG
jgi:hypothetical protein